MLWGFKFKRPCLGTPSIVAIMLLKHVFNCDAFILSYLKNVISYFGKALQ